MSKRIAGPEIERLIQLVAKVPGLGPRSARRAALHLIKKKEQLLSPLAAALSEAVEKVRSARSAAMSTRRTPAWSASILAAMPRMLIVVEDVSDLWALERSGAMNVRYHVLGGTLSPLDGIGPEQLNIRALVDRVAGGEVRKSSSPLTPRSRARPRRITLPTSSPASASRSHGWRMACRSAANSTISTRARCRRR